MNMKKQLNLSEKWSKFSKKKCFGSMQLYILQKVVSVMQFL